MNQEEQIKKAAEIVSNAQKIVAFTGAGTSVESGIPPFRGEGGIWNKYDLLSLAFSFVYGFLPFLTRSFSVLDNMAHSLEENGIDPSRYYYTDVEQVKEGELYLRGVLALSAKGVIKEQ